MPSLIKTQPLAARKPALGRGLGALLADARAPAPATRAAAATSNTGLVQLAKGPPAGTRVVANSASLLLDGDLVRPQEGAAPAPAPQPAVKR